jgi:hypothetical protein
MLPLYITVDVTKLTKYHPTQLDTFLYLTDDGADVSLTAAEIGCS